MEKLHPLLVKRQSGRFCSDFSSKNVNILYLVDFVRVIEFSRDNVGQMIAIELVNAAKHAGNEDVFATVFC